MSFNMISTAIARVMPAAIASGLAASTATVKEPSGTLDAAGAPDGLYVDVAGMIGLRVMMAPLYTGERMGADELKALSEQAAMQLKHVWMEAFYPSIVAGWRIVVDGTAHDILGVEWDSQSQMTRLKVQVLNV